jgi:hypothetical protein
MDVTNTQGVLRAILSAVGGLLIARGWVSADLWTLVTGFLAAGVTAYWSWKANAFGLEQYLGLVRTFLAAVGGFVAQKGWLSADQAAQVTGVALTVAQAIWSVFFKTEAKAA